MYYARALSHVIKNISETFPVLLVTGPRQVGKTTLLEHLKESGRKYVTLDDLDERALAQKDPALFLQKHPPPVLIDEIQYAPNLFSAIKLYVDQRKENGLFWLTGSQKFELMRGISETLAGRVGVCELLGLSRSEIYHAADLMIPFLPTEEWFLEMRKTKKKRNGLLDIYHDIWKGSFPKLLSDPKISREIFYSSYIQTYIQRDVRDLSKVGDLITFQRFLKVAAARTGQLLNYADMARDVDVDQKTIKAWISILETSGLIYLLYPYHTNLTKRLIKTPKFYFLDTGLCSYLTGWSSPESLESGSMSGAILETYLLAELLKTYWYNGIKENFYFYRDKDQKEIDLLIEYDQTLYPIEFKKTATPSLNSVKNFHTLENLGLKIGHGVVICLKEKEVALSNDVTAIPITYLD
jgi:predicted AAA+ superfamily ATPase